MIQESGNQRLVVRLLGFLTVILLTLVPGAMPAAEGTNQFLFLTLRLKAGVITLQKASVVSGTLKPQQDSTDTEPLLVALEQADGSESWSLAIDDPSIQRYEYEDPQQPGGLKSKLVPVDDVEFIARVPFTAGVRRIAIYRKEKGAERGTAAAPSTTRKLLARIDLPKEVTK